MQDIYETKIKVITLVIVLRAVGSVIGAFSSGLLLDKCPKWRYFILFGCTCLLGLCIAILPHMVYIWALFLVSIVCSFACGALDTGGNVLCLDTWKDASGPYLHSIHFSFAVKYLCCISSFLSDKNPLRVTIILLGWYLMIKVLLGLLATRRIIITIESHWQYLSMISLVEHRDALNRM